MTNPDLLLSRITPELVAGDGAGVRVGVIDAALAAGDPALRGRVIGGVVIREAPRPPRKSWSGRADFRLSPYDGKTGDPHATAAAGVILSIAPAVELVSVDIGGPRWDGPVEALIEGLQRALQTECGVLYVGGGAARGALVAARRFHLSEAVEQAYRAGAVVVAAAHPDHPVAAAIPATFAVPVSVGRDGLGDPLRFLYRMDAGVEFAADARGRATEAETVSTSFAAARVVGWACRVRSRCPELRPFEVKTVLYRLAEWFRRNPGSA